MHIRSLPIRFYLDTISTMVYTPPPTTPPAYCAASAGTIFPGAPFFSASVQDWQPEARPPAGVQEPSISMPGWMNASRSRVDG